MTKDAATLAQAHEIFDPIAARFLERPGVDIGTMFGSEGLRVRGKVFAFVGHLGGLVVKIPEVRVTELEEQGAAKRMIMRERPMREWATVGVEAGPQRWDELIGEAYAFLDEITP
ncbi:TfoX N-terminal domain-containing protein [Microbacterium sp. cf046]|uniref:MmcQ/YjbR family DNA-binding protein n=1 Tax=Microbacterium sp. cf046 TaxID=1761803 RepID=UPI0008E0E0CA|nr:MmcQ/YjbR family DNA-binding protein [Microbacterium sp. cf046]SFR89367.1 TfoX N-terminal domain-containing protein [Microbacterium sp. cf046]